MWTSLHRLLLLPTPGNPFGPPGSPGGRLTASGRKRARKTESPIDSGDAEGTVVVQRSRLSERRAIVARSDTDITRRSWGHEES